MLLSKGWFRLAKVVRNLSEQIGNRLISTQPRNMFTEQVCSIKAKGFQQLAKPLFLAWFHRGHSGWP
jgi:hypothetical protein